ncbi:MAG: MFS transporter [Betaproteobacteria bacterium]|nr:MAG: MFS transporter [Betaproteobacteria bacterium]
MSEPPALAVPGLAIAALSLGAFGAAASARVADPMLPALATGYGVGIGTAANVVTLFTLAYGVFQIVLGPFGDRYGKYRVIGWACATSAATALGCALAPTFGTLTVARFVAGATCAAIVPLSMAWIGDVLPYERRQPVLARFLIGQMLGFSAGSLLGGLGAEHFGIHTPFVFLALWFAGAAAIVFAMPRRMNPPGLAQTKGASLATLPAGIAYVWKQRWARIVLLAVFLEGTFMFGAFAFIATHLHRHYGISLSFAGTLVMLYGAGGILFAALSTILVRRLGEAGLATTGGVLICAMLIVIDATERWPLAALAVLVMGTGFYMLHNTLQTNATQMAPEKRGTAVSQFAFCLFVGQSVGVALAGLIAERADTDAVLAAGAFGVLAVALAFAQLRRTRQRRVEISA